MYPTRPHPPIMMIGSSLVFLNRIYDAINRITATTSTTPSTISVLETIEIHDDTSSAHTRHLIPFNAPVITSNPLYLK